MQPIENQLKDYVEITKEVEANYADAIKYWWDKWHCFVEYDTEQEMLTLVPNWIKNMIGFVENLSAIKGIKVKYNYERGLFQSY